MNATAAVRPAPDADAPSLRQRLARMPQHVAIVMDGNGRWAEARGKPRHAGHRAGQKAVRTAIEFCMREGIGALTLFAFSSENWRRPQTEISALMELFLRALDREVKSLHRNNIRVRFIGDVSAFQPALRERMHRAEALTAGNTALSLNIAVSYGGRQDIVAACRAVAGEVQAGRLTIDDVDEAVLHGHTALADLPPLDLFIRTGGEQRVSNFLLWQLAYAELYFTDTLWPDVDADVLTAACIDFAGRERRFGLTSAQVRP
jgi:undecaprenyl diphosphate synthase